MPSLDDVATIQAKLQAERAKLVQAFVNVSDAAMTRRSADGGWSIQDVLAHVVMAESVNVKFARMMVELESPLQLHEFAREYPDFPGPFELDKFNAWMTERWRVRPLQEVLAGLEQTRQETLGWLATLSLAQLERGGEHAVWGNLSVRGMFRILVIHDKFHRNDIEKIKQSLAPQKE